MNNKNVIKDDLYILYRWVTSSIENYSEIDSIKQRIHEKYRELPNRVKNGNDKEYTIDSLLIELIQSIECSNRLKYLLLNRGRKAISLSALSIILLTMFLIFILPILMHLNSFYIEYRPILFFLIPISSLLLIFSEQISKIILKTSKPGDLLKILSEKDELILTREPSQVIRNGTIVTKDIQVSVLKKQAICKFFINEYDRKKTKTMNDYIVCFLCLDHLLHFEFNESYQEFYTNKALFVLEYINAFKPGNKFIFYNLAFCYLANLELEKSLQNFIKYKERVNDDNQVNAWIIVLEFIKRMS